MGRRQLARGTPRRLLCTKYGSKVLKAMRLFVAIELDHPVRRALEKAQEQLRRRSDAVRWVHPSLMHLTVRFLGDVPDDRVPAVSEAIAAAARAAEPFAMTVGGCGCFPPRGAVRTVWAGVKEESGCLSRCAEAVNSQLEGSVSRISARCTQSRQLSVSPHRRLQLSTHP